MSAVGSVGGLLLSLEKKTRSRLGVDAQQAREALARELRCAPGTLTNILKGRVKSVKDGLTDRIEGALLKAVRHQISRLKDEEAAIMAGSARRNRARALEEIEKDVALLRAALKEEG